MLSTGQTKHDVDTDRYMKILDTIAIYAETIMSAIIYFSSFTKRFDAPIEKTVLLDVDTEIVMPFKTEYSAKFSTKTIVLEHSKARISQVLIGKTSSAESSEPSYMLMFVDSKGEVVADLVVPPKRIEDVALILNNRELAEQISVKAPYIATYIDDVIIISNFADKQSLASASKNMLVESDELVSSDTSLIVSVPISGKKVKGLKIYRERMFKNILGEWILSPFSQILIELHIQEKPLLLPLMLSDENRIFRRPYAESLLRLAELLGFMDDITRELPLATKRRSEELLYMIGVLNAVRRMYEL